MQFKVAYLPLIAAVLPTSGAAWPNDLKGWDWGFWGFADGCPQDHDSVRSIHDGFIDKGAARKVGTCNYPLRGTNGGPYTSLLIFGLNANNLKLSVYEGIGFCNEADRIYTATSDGCQVMPKGASVGSYKLEPV